MNKIKLVLILLCLMVSPCLLLAQDSPKIFKIDITGNEKIDTGFIVNNIKSKEKEVYNLDKIRDDMKNIYKSGFFSDVQIDIKDTDKGKSITFIVIERPPIKAIFISGNKEIKTPDLVEKLKIRTNSVLNTERVKESIDELKKFYSGKGYYAIKINYGIDYGEEYNATVNINIEEPKQAYVKKILFTGNKAFKAGTLKNYIRTKEKGILSWITGSGILDSDALEEDRKYLESFYNDNGYVRSYIGVPDIAVSKDGKSIVITMPVEEGNQYKIGTIDFTGDVMFTRNEYSNKLKTRTGNIFRSSLFHEDVLTLTDLYQDLGYAFCEITPLTIIDDSSRNVNVTYKMTKGQEVYFNRINILGNTNTRDKVIRRELKITEGDRFSASHLKESKRKLKNTTFFKETDMKIIKTEDPNKVNVDLTVEERPTGTISVGAGYSTTESVLLSGSISQENLLGTGRKLVFDASLGGITRQFRLTYLEPYIFDKNLSAGFSAFDFRRVFDTYDYTKRGGSIALIRPLTDYIKASSRYRLEGTNVTSISSTATQYIKDQKGESTTSAISFGLQKNSIDDIMNPTDGVSSDITAEFAGLGGDNYFYSFIGSYGRYFPAKFLDSAFFVKGTAGYIESYGGKEVPIFEKFYVGGLSSIRGFKYGEAGPLDANGEPIGGKYQIFANFEWIFPIHKPAGLKGVIFFDYGNAFDRIKDFKLKSTAGFGIRWLSPFGPIRLELGFNLRPTYDERQSAFDFAIGTQY